MFTSCADPSSVPAAIAEALGGGDAARVLSPAGLERYRRAAQSLWLPGRSERLAIAFAAHAPPVAQAVGEDVLPGFAAQMLLLASKTSGGVIERIIETAPLAARRLGDAPLFDAYLELLAHIAAQAPRGLRPMLDKIDLLLAQLTLGGLRRWAEWGIAAHRTHPGEQAGYFGVASADSIAVLQQQRRGTLFVDGQRRIGMFLRALFGREFAMRPSAEDAQLGAARPFIEGCVIHLPDAFDDIGAVPGMELYRASAVHCAAHLVYGAVPMPAQPCDALQAAAVGMLEDARIEQLAMARFPNLRRLWAPLHTASPLQAGGPGDYLDRIARALLDPGYEDPHPLVAWARDAYGAAMARGGSNLVAWQLGTALARELAALGVAFDPERARSAAPYRDDNRWLWARAGQELESAGAPAHERARGERKVVSLMEMVNEVEVETAGADAGETWVLQSELFPYEDHGVSYNETEGKAAPAVPVPYPEWDYQTGLERPAWTRVLEQRIRARGPERVEQVLEKHKRLLGRLRYVVDALQPCGVQRIRRREDGDEIDLNAAIEAWIAMQRGEAPDPRLTIRHQRSARDIAVLILLDLSASTNDIVPGSRQSILELAFEATVLTAETLHQVGDPFALHGFSSDGRHAVHYHRFKDFGQPYDALAKGRLGAMAGALSTRMGAAIRHASSVLRQQPQRQKLLLVLTDGAPSDVDVRDPVYLRLDTKKAVDDAARSGVTTFCVSLDPGADEYVARIFGGRHYLVLDHVRSLPERLPLLYSALAK